MRHFIYEKNAFGITREEIRCALLQSLEGRTLRRVLIVPPDFTRLHSNAGLITNEYYHILTERGCQVDILPALGSHDPVTREQAAAMYGDIPFSCFTIHNWRTDIVKIGEIPEKYLQEITEGYWKTGTLPVEINRMVMDPAYDLILSVGQVVPHEVIGMANQAKNLFVGVGGCHMINESHMIGAAYGMERIMGKDHSPVRKLFDYGMAHFLAERPILFVLTVCSAPGGETRTHGLFLSEDRSGLEAAIALSQKVNIIYVDHPIKKCVTFLDPEEFHTTWVGNKAVYRARMAMADGGELIVLAPGVRKFGEDPLADQLIRKYGYCGRENVLRLFQAEENQDLRDNAGVAAHLIHGSSDGRFHVTYAVQEISEEEVRSVGFGSAAYAAAARQYGLDTLRDGYQTLPDGEEIYFIPNPALGLWISRDRL